LVSTLKEHPVGLENGVSAIYKVLLLVHREVIYMRWCHIGQDMCGWGRGVSQEDCCTIEPLLSRRLRFRPEGAHNLDIASIS